MKKKESIVKKKNSAIIHNRRNFLLCGYSREKHIKSTKKGVLVSWHLVTASLLAHNGSFLVLSHVTSFLDVKYRECLFQNLSHINEPQVSSDNLFGIVHKWRKTGLYPIYNRNMESLSALPETSLNLFIKSGMKIGNSQNDHGSPIRLTYVHPLVT